MASSRHCLSIYKILFGIIDEEIINEVSTTKTRYLVSKIFVQICKLKNRKKIFLRLNGQTRCDESVI